MGKRHRHELTDTQWEKIGHLLPGTRSDPGRFGKPDTVRKRFDRWAARGVWRTIAAATGEADLVEVQLDSTTIQAHPIASTGRRRAGEKKRTPTRGVASAAAAAG